MTVTDRVTNTDPSGGAGGDVVRRFEEDGFTVARGLFAPAEIDALCAEFAALHARGPVPHFEPRSAGSPVRRPAARLPAGHKPAPHQRPGAAPPPRTPAAERPRTVVGEEVLAARSMFYFKPPGARGQALHQDNFYLRVEPGTCVAAWIACDVIDRENGGLEVSRAPTAWTCSAPKRPTRCVVRPRVRPAAAGLAPFRSTWSPVTSCSSTAAWCTAPSPTAAPTASAARTSATMSAAPPRASAASTPPFR